MSGVDTRGLSDNARSQILRIAAEDILDHIISGWPFDSGESISSFQIRQSGNSWSVVNPLRYVPYVHGGLVDRLFDEGSAIARPAAEERVKRARQPAQGRQRRSRGVSFGRVARTVASGALASLPTSRLLRIRRDYEAGTTIRVLSRRYSVPEKELRAYLKNARA